MTNSRPTNAATVIPQPSAAAVMNAVSAPAGQEPTLELASIGGVVARLRAALSSGDEDRRLECEALVLGQLAAARKRAVEHLLPFLTEMMRGRDGRGAEGLFLSVLSAAGDSPEVMRALGAISLAPVVNEERAPFFFADLSMPHRALISVSDRSKLPGIFRGLTLSARTGLDVGNVVRAGGAGGEERSMLAPGKPKFEDCVNNWALLGGALGAAAGYAAGGLAGAGLGAMSGANAGKGFGELVCGTAYGKGGGKGGGKAGGREVGELPSLALTPPVKPDVPASVPYCGFVGEWCGTIPRPWIPRCPIPRQPRPGCFPLPRPLPVPAFLGGGVGGHEAATFDTNALLDVVSGSGIDVEPLAETIFLVHGLPE